MSTLIVTVTHGRPRAFQALQTWVTNQTTDDFDWLVVSDNWEGYKFPKGPNVKVVKRDASGDTLPSICHNMLAAVEFIEKNEKYDKIVVLEDDDYYASSFVRETKVLLDKAELVGWHEDAYYYVISRKARRCHNVGHASLAATAFRRSVLPYLKECCEQGTIFIDLALWRGIGDGEKGHKEFRGKKMLCDNFTGIVWGAREQTKLDKSGNAIEKPRHVGLKENWHLGVDGLSISGHNPASGGGPDIRGDVLRRWIGDEAAAFYLKVTDEPYNKLYPPVAGGTGMMYAPGVVLPLPIESDR